MILKLLWLSNIIFVMYVIDISISVPPLYCLQPLNGSDCQGKPTPVFSYYKPGSRCEIEIWRGCPTTNKFDNDYLCSHFCIFNFLRPISERLLNLYQNLYQSQDTCQKYFDDSKCTNETVPVFTYNSRTQKCDPAIWRGCYTANIFQDKASCESICKPVKKALNFASKLKRLSHGVASNIKSILDSIVTDNIEDINETTLSTSTYTKMEEIMKDVPQQTNIGIDSISTTAATVDTINITTPTNIDDISETATNISTVEPETTTKLEATDSVKEETVNTTTAFFYKGTVESTEVI